MIGILVELILSWLLLWLCCKKDLSVLGIKPTTQRSTDLAAGFIVAAAFCTAYYFAGAYFSGNRFAVNKDFTLLQFFKSFGWTLRSVLFEELIFRGALLYIAIRKFGVNTACIISAAAFGIYHWFTFGGLGNPAQMAIIFFTTGIWGWMFAWSFAKTKSLYLPVGIHLGWNLLSNVIFSKGPLSKQL